MRVTRTKKARKNLALYEKLFGFHEPFQVLMDGTFTLAALTRKIHLAERIPRYLGATAQLLTTKCLLAEVSRLGAALMKVEEILKKVQQRKCKHKPCVAAAECIKKMVSNGNHHNYVIATQDPQVMEALKDIPGIPILTINGGRLYLMKPSKATLDKQQQSVSSKLQVGSLEDKVLKKLNEKHGLVGTQVKVHKRRKVKGPNPLSVKKPKGTTSTSASKHLKSKSIHGKATRKRKNKVVFKK